MLMHYLENCLNFYLRNYIEALDILQILYKLGFRVISHEVNLIVGPNNSDNYYHYIEVVLMKETS